MLRVGLTGGIGSGKSTVSGRLAELGAVVIDSDLLAREVVAPGTDGLRDIVAAFGEGVLAADGSLDRAALAGIVFSDDEARRTLNGIVHPRVGARTGEMMAAAPSDAIVVHDVPLLVEKGMAPAYHLVLVVDAPVEERVRRLVAVRGMAEPDARSRIAAQAGDEQRRATADVWLDNGGERAVVLSEVDRLWAERLVPFEANVREQRVHRAGSPKIAEYDPDWPAQAARLISRIQAATSGAPVEHIGSTSVPGLAAKDVIDLQLGVDSLEEADKLAHALGEAGFPRYPEPLSDTVLPSHPDPEMWRKRVHCSADPGRPVNVHVRVREWPAWRYALVFRDWMRAHPEEVAAYAALKRELAPAFAADGGATRYADAKDPWMHAALARAIEWAGGHADRPW
ncbi:dephospho-CoA kinase [Allokutzneria sp. A3M-2-11 16]|uniref:dephospho-CoA kinase n=1 Tax=Allokutzneria sp. A3M-2-11 16 TaxID=2962043 RepID=UPI0020B65A27|nr:dephospho-CoA kinase [Allokutzneria sp. A3M-2-11 16]MCP3802485.1 dephospho-CoA kinase [Allokutzneria sp. A3M-2-11 16]